MTFGEKLQSARRAAGLSQEQLAELLGMSRQAISKWETGESVPDVEKLRALCAVFHLSADELLGIEGEKGNKSDEKADTGLGKASQFNMRRRVFTAGWITALAGTVLMVLEYLSLFIIQEKRIAIALETGMGFYQDAMDYAQVEPMHTVFRITAIFITVGVLQAVLTLIWPWLERILEKLGRGTEK